MKKLFLLFIIIAASLAAQSQSSRRWDNFTKVKVSDSLKLMQNKKGNTAMYLLCKDTVSGLVYILPMDSISGSAEVLWYRDGDYIYPDYNVMAEQFYNNTEVKYFEHSRASFVSDFIGNLTINGDSVFHHSDTLNKLVTPYDLLSIPSGFWAKHLAGSSYIKSPLYTVMLPIIVDNDSVNIFYSDLGSNDMYIGRSAGMGAGIKSGTYNLFVGRSSGYNITSGSYNSFFGNNSGYGNTSGEKNVFVGSFSGYTNTDGDDNVFVGRNSGYTNSTGLANTFIGSLAGYNSTGSNNSFFGNYAGNYMTAESGITIFNNFNQTNKAGDSTGSWGYTRQNINPLLTRIYFNGNVKVSKSLTVGNDSVFVRNDTSKVGKAGLMTKWYAENRFALKASTSWESPSGSNASGYKRLKDSKKLMANEMYLSDSTIAARFGTKYAFIGSTNTSTADYNYVIGYEAGKVLSSGTQNVFLGYRSGYAATTTVGNMCIGSQSGFSLTTSVSGNYNTFIGLGTGYYSTGTNNLFLGYYSGLNLTTESDYVILNSRNRTDKAGDLNYSPFVSHQTSDTLTQTIDLNGKVTIAGNTIINGDLTYLVRHAHLYFNDSTETISLTQNVYSHLTNETKTLFTVDETSNVTCQGDTITIITAGDYLLTFDFNGDGNGANDIYKFKLYKNNVAVPGSTVSKGVTSSVGWNWYLEDLVAGDDLKIMITNTVDNDDIIANNAVIYLRKEH
jgi:hypothetical protein